MHLEESLDATTGLRCPALCFGEDPVPRWYRVPHMKTLFQRLDQSRHAVVVGFREVIHPIRVDRNGCGLNGPFGPIGLELGWPPRGMISQPSSRVRGCPNPEVTSSGHLPPSTPNPTRSVDPIEPKMIMIPQTATAA